MSVKSPLWLVLYCYLNMPTINKTYLIYLSIIITNMINTQQQYLYPCGNLQAAQVGSVFVD